MVLVTKSKMDDTLINELDETLNSETLIHKLTQGDFHLLGFDFETNLVHLLSHQHLEAIITNKKFSPSPFNTNEQVDTLFILVIPESSQALDNHILNKIDFVLPANPLSLSHQLTQIVRLTQRAYALEHEVHRLETEVIHQKRKNAEIEIVKNAIVRNVSHELRTPLLQVKSAVALISEDSSDEKLNNYAQNAVARLETHIKNITMLGHSLDININPIILRDSLEYAKRHLTRMATYRDEVILIELELENNLPPIMADKQGLSTVFQLLMDNALKFSDNKEIRVTARKLNDIVRVGIHDNGIGIAEDKIQEIFDSFYQVDATSTRPYGGAGVGLALVKLILEYHGIDIHVDSKVNEGSTFWFDIPTIDMSSLK